MRVADAGRDCGVFIGRLRGDGLMEKKDLLGTGFIVTHPFEESKSDLSKTFLYIITAKHVVDGLNGADCGIRINNNDGTASILTSPERWWTHPSDPTVDVALVPFGPPKDVPFQ